MDRGNPGLRPPSGDASNPEARTRSLSVAELQARALDRGARGSGSRGRTTTITTSDGQRHVRPVPSLAAKIEKWHTYLGIPPTEDLYGLIFPRDWKIGTAPYLIPNEDKWWDRLESALPTVQFFTNAGDAQREPGEGGVQSVKASLNWQPVVEIARQLLTYRANRDVSREQVLELATRSPDAFEKVKQCARDLKMHITRQLDPVAMRRDPKFNDVALRWKAEIRARVAAFDDLNRQRTAALRALNQALADRDTELHALDPGYAPKKVRAVDALASYGIPLDEEGASALDQAIASRDDDLAAILEEDF